MISDEKKDIAVKILNDVLGLQLKIITRFNNGYCHSVYYIKTDNGEFVMRITGRGNKEYYRGSVKWFSALRELGVPVPELLKHGCYGDVFYTLISYISGKDLGDVYNILTSSEKKNIAKSLAQIQRTVSSLPHGKFYGYTADDITFTTWADFIQSQLKRSAHRILQNKIWGTDIFDNVKLKADMLSDYFHEIKPIAFLGDVTTKNVLVNNGELIGIVDVDEICYGDPLSVIGLTNMALLSMGTDTKYIDYWLDEISFDNAGRKAVSFYTLLSCLVFMSEQGMTFDNGKSVVVNNDKIRMLSAVYSRLHNAL